MGVREGLAGPQGASGGRGPVLWGGRRSHTQATTRAGPQHSSLRVGLCLSEHVAGFPQEQLRPQEKV